MPFSAKCLREIPKLFLCPLFSSRSSESERNRDVTPNKSLLIGLRAVNHPPRGRNLLDIDNRGAARRNLACRTFADPNAGSRGHKKKLPLCQMV
ncbi:hypothetical protein JTE90_016782 [Oedothorax gibbosus]|uniref:Uncharacterized protein n=1 Tax=Oedothorax gibbosus TaxID=931172 RepID=A0AAV6VXC3_9ARAC|nr:hypothetical protein JTE90_016782 [Oedothorax gibbosus]